MTGSAVFDFEADGAAEVVYSDEEYFGFMMGDRTELQWSGHDLEPDEYPECRHRSG